MSQERFGNIAVGVLAVCAIISTAVLLVTVVNGRQRGQITEITPPTASRLPTDLKVAGLGHALGTSGNVPAMALIADFECPYCREFALGPLRELLNSGQVVTFINFPLPNHRLAGPAAMAAVCAGAAGKFEAFHDALFLEQDSLGLKPFERFAEQAGIEDIKAFDTCRTSDSARILVENEVEFSRKLGVTGTPAMIIGDSLFIGVMSAKLLLERVANASAVLE